MRKLFLVTILAILTGCSEKASVNKISTPVEEILIENIEIETIEVETII